MQFHDLIGVRFEVGSDDIARGLDCWGVSRIVLRRLGFVDPGPVEAMTVQPKRVALRASPHALLLGDVLSMELPERDAETGACRRVRHVAPVVVIGRQPMALHALKGSLSCCLPLRRLGADAQVYRFPRA